MARTGGAKAATFPRSRVLKDDAVGDIATMRRPSLERLANLRSLPKGFDRSKWGAISWPPSSAASPAIRQLA